MKYRMENYIANIVEKKCGSYQIIIRWRICLRHRSKCLWTVRNRRMRLLIRLLFEIPDGIPDAGQVPAAGQDRVQVVIQTAVQEGAAALRRWSEGVGASSRRGKKQRFEKKEEDC